MKGRQSKIMVILVLVLLLAVSVYRKQQSITGKTALIIDQLYMENLDFGFAEQAQELLSSNGYEVRTFLGDDITLDLFYGLDWGADVIILRMHSGVFDDRTWLFTHEEYDSSKHVLEQLSREANIGRCGSVDYPVFTVSSSFFERSIEFDESLVIVMGCNGLEKDDLGSALMNVGAGAVVGWETAIGIEETDEMVLGFMERLLDGGSLGAAVEGTGLAYYPVEAEGFRFG